MGEVYKAFDTQRDRYVALKLLPTVLSADREYFSRFQRESYVIARLRDPHIIPIHDFGEIEGHLYIDMRLVDGTDVASLLQANGPLTPERASYIVGQVAEALDAAHADHLVHRDIKPSNILVTSRDFVYVVDFGIARSMGSTQQTALTVTGSTVGTLNYMAPERFAGQDIDGRADVYSLACVLHECLTGASPFAGKDLPSLIYAHLYAGVPRARPNAYRSRSHMPSTPGVAASPLIVASVSSADVKFCCCQLPNVGGSVDAGGAIGGAVGSVISAAYVTTS